MAPQYVMSQASVEGSLCQRSVASLNGGTDVDVAVSPPHHREQSGCCHDLHASEHELHILDIRTTCGV